MNQHSANREISDDGLTLVDGLLAKLKRTDLILFNVIKWRYVYNESYKEIVKRLGKKSPKVAGTYLFNAETRFEGLIWQS